MKKLLLSSAAVCGLAAFAATPAMAQIEVTIGGHSKNYIGYLDQDESTGNEVAQFDMLRESEIHILATGVADNGLEYGFNVEMEVDGGDSSNTIDESYLFLSGDWGRINLGSEDGANYLLQVAAPSADANIDGLRQYIQPVNYSITDAGATGTTVASNLEVLDYDNDFSGKTEKITYLSPIFSGFQAGLSFTPNVSEDNGSVTGRAGFGREDENDEIGEVYDAALRYEGNFNNVGVAVGGGYTHGELEADGNTGLDDVTEWNVGLDLDIGAFGIGAVYTENNGGQDNDGDSDTIVVGLDYTTGPFKLGASYLTNTLETGANAELETDRYTGGVIYTAAEGLTFRGTVSHVAHELTGGANPDIDATSVMGGVQFNF